MIYLVEDDENIRELVTYALKSMGLDAESFDTPSAFWSAMQKGQPSLVLLDIMLPDEDGLTILKKLKRTPRRLYCKALRRYGAGCTSQGETP